MLQIENRRRHVRGFALLLCMALCLESTSLTAFAEEPAAAISENTIPNTSEEPGETEGPVGDGIEPGGGIAGETTPQEPVTGDPEEPGGEESEPGGNTPEEPKPQEPASGEESGPEDDATGETGPQEPAEEEPDGDGMDEPTDTVSENTLDTVSENTLESISENSLGEEWQALAREAEEAFDALLFDKQMMALLYRTEQYTLRQEADEESAAAETLEIGQTLYLQGVTITEEDVWYRVQYFLNGAEGTGYVQGYYLAYADEDWIAWEGQYLQPVRAFFEKASAGGGRRAKAFRSAYAVDSSDIDAFPASYQSALRSLKNAHPNWTFVPANTGLDFQTAVSNEMGDKSLIQNTSSNASKGWVGKACPSESGWYYALQPAVAYHMDPRNFLTETYIFQFEQLTFNASYHTESAVQGFLDGTFMRGTLPDDGAGRTYARAFYEIGSSRKLSPIHLASRVYQEQGQGTSGLISGTYAGYEGYYNFFNVGVNGASTAEKIRKGLEYAKSKGWNTRYKSLEGGAATIGNNYILKGQDTLYLEKFNVGKDSQHPVYTHQYMQNIQAPASEASTTKKMYANAGSLNSAFVFKIPVYKNMPDEQGDSDKPESPLQSISLDKTEVRLRRPDTVVEDTTGLNAAEKEENTDTVTLQVSFDPKDTTSDKTIVWTSSNQKIAKVTADPDDPAKAVVQAVGAGEATIAAKASQAGNLTAACQVTVSAPIYRLVLTNRNAQETDPADQATLFVGQSINLSAEYWPKDTTSDTRITWSSSDPSVATVKNGKVTAVGENPEKKTAVITARAAGCEKGYEASYTVTLESCTVTFMKPNGAGADGNPKWAALGKVESVPYGGSLTAETFQAKQEEVLRSLPAESIFIGWYTGENGTGAKFDENVMVHGRNITLYPYYVEKGKGFFVYPIGDQTYTGSAIKPVVRVYDSAGTENGEPIELVLNRDYTVSYQNNKNVDQAGRAEPAVTVKGKGNYAGTQKMTFHIVPKALTDTDIIVDDIAVAYSGKVIKSSPTVYRNGKKLKKNTDYTVNYPQTDKGAYQAVGVYPIVITGKGGYTGRITVYENISKDILLSKVSVGKIAKQAYSSEKLAKEGGIRPDSLKVTYKKRPLEEGRDYTVTYTNDQSVGKATATLTAVEGSGYIGSKSVTYQITGTPISKAKVEGLVNKAYTGEENDVRQTGYRLTLEGSTLQESQDGGKTGDYTVSYLKTDRAGTATIVFKGVNAYSGQMKKTYRIAPYQFDEGKVGAGRDITLSYYTQDDLEPKELTSLNEIVTPYVKGGSKPTVLLSFHGQPLLPGKDYTISYKNNNALTTNDLEEKKLPTFTITGKGSFKGKLAGNFKITDGRMKDKVTLIAKDVVYQDKAGAYKTKVVLQDVNGQKLTAGKDYDKELLYTYEAETKAGLPDGTTASRKKGQAVGDADILSIGTVIRVTARGIGAYQGEGIAECIGTYRVVAADLAKVKIKVGAKSYLAGQPVLLTAEDLTLTANGTAVPLVYGTDYEILETTYQNHTKKGKAKVTLRGIGNFGGEKTITYTIGARKFWW